MNYDADKATRVLWKVLSPTAPRAAWQPVLIGLLDQIEGVLSTLKEPWKTDRRQSHLLCLCLPDRRELWILAENERGLSFSVKANQYVSNSEKIVIPGLDPSDFWIDVPAGVLRTKHQDKDGKDDALVYLVGKLAEWLLTDPRTA